MCVTADKTCIFHKSVMNTRTKGTVIRTVPFLMPRFPKMLENGLNTEVLISLIIKLDFFR